MSYSDPSSPYQKRPEKRPPQVVLLLPALVGGLLLTTAAGWLLTSGGVRDEFSFQVEKPKLRGENVPPVLKVHVPEKVVRSLGGENDINWSLAYHGPTDGELELSAESQGNDYVMSAASPLPVGGVYDLWVKGKARGKEARTDARSWEVRETRKLAVRKVQVRSRLISTGQARTTYRVTVTWQPPSGGTVSRYRISWADITPAARAALNPAADVGDPEDEDLVPGSQAAWSKQFYVKVTRRARTVRFNVAAIFEGAEQPAPSAWAEARLVYTAPRRAPLPAPRRLPRLKPSRPPASPKGVKPNSSPRKEGRTPRHGMSPEPVILR